MQQLKEGHGWRLGWNPDAAVFKGLVGGDRWAVEMTQDEFDDFCRLSRQLADTLQAMSAELMDEERIACEHETEHIWVAVEGFLHQYSLQFILLNGRRSEGSWPDAVVPDLMQNMSAINVF